MPDKEGNREYLQDGCKDTQDFMEYCMLDVLATREILDTLLLQNHSFGILRDLRVALATRKVNDYGIKVDTKLCSMAIMHIDKLKSKGSELVYEITEGHVDNLGSTDQILGFVNTEVTNNYSDYEHMDVLMYFMSLSISKDSGFFKYDKAKMKKLENKRIKRRLNISMTTIFSVYYKMLEMLDEAFTTSSFYIPKSRQLRMFITAYTEYGQTSTVVKREIYLKDIDEAVSNSIVTLLNAQGAILNNDIYKLISVYVAVVSDFLFYLRSKKGLHSLNKNALAVIQIDEYPERSQRLLTVRSDYFSTSLKKYERALEVVNIYDHIVRENYVYCKTRTGRWAGRSLQLQNAPRDALYPNENGEEFDINAIKDNGTDGLEKYVNDFYGGKSTVMKVLKASIRSMLVPREISKEHKTMFAVADYSSIEARVVAWLSNQEDLLEAFINEQPIYELQAAYTFDVPVEEIKEGSIERFVGKTLVLACGYGMGATKFQHQCSLNGKNLSLELCQKAVASYREKNREIVREWYDQERALRECLNSGCATMCGKITWELLDFKQNKIYNIVKCLMPSGRYLFYYNVYIEEIENEATGDITSEIVAHVAGSCGGLVKTKLYGGKIVENIVQALSRDITAYALVNLCESDKYFPVLHSHDEIMSEFVDDGSRTHDEVMEEYVSIMCKRAEWFIDLPISAKGCVIDRYKKL